MARESKGVCPVCQSQVYVSNPIWIERRVKDIYGGNDGRAVSRDPYHEQCYAARELGLMPEQG